MRTTTYLRQTATRLVLVLVALVLLLPRLLPAQTPTNAIPTYNLNWTTAGKDSDSAVVNIFSGTNKYTRQTGLTNLGTYAARIATNALAGALSNQVSTAKLVATGTGTNQIGYSTFTYITGPQYLYQGADGLVVGVDAPTGGIDTNIFSGTNTWTGTNTFTKVRLGGVTRTNWPAEGLGLSNYVSIAASGDIDAPGLTINFPDTDGTVYINNGALTVAKSVTAQQGIVAVGTVDATEFYGDGSGLYNVDASTANIASQAALIVPAQAQLYPASSATNFTINMASAQSFFINATNNVYLNTLTNRVAGQHFNLWVLQDSTGNRTVTFNTNHFKFPYGVAPTATTNAGAYDLYQGLILPYGTNAIVTLQPWVR